MKTPNLLEVPKTHPTRHERLAAFKMQHSIWTHRSHHQHRPWSALAVELAQRALGDRAPEDPDPLNLIAQYCRLLDEANLLVTGTSELDAIRTLCAFNHIPCDL